MESQQTDSGDLQPRTEEKPPYFEPLAVQITDGAAAGYAKQ